MRILYHISPPTSLSCALRTLTIVPLSEQKRRQAIREGFDRLTELVPGLEGMGRSEGLVLQRTVEFMRDQIEERRRLMAQIEENGGQVDGPTKRFVCPLSTSPPRLWTLSERMMLLDR